MKKTIVNPLYKDKVIFVQTVGETDGKITELELELNPEGSNPLHLHTTFTETFTAVKGRLGLKLAKGKTLILNPGESYKVEKKELHGFYNPEEHNIEFNIKIEPGHQGFEYALRIMYGLAEDGLTDKNGIPKDLGVAFILAEMNDSSIDSFIFKILTPLGKFLAKKAKRKGVKEALIKKYCV